MRVGIIGLGSIARKHIDALRSIDPGVSLHALRHSPDAPREHGVNNVFSYDDLLACRPDFIIISNPTANHREAIGRLAQESIPLFIEKPLQDDLTAPVVAKAHSYVACNLRFLDCLQYLKTAISGQRIDEVNSYCGSYLPLWRPGADWRACYSANREMGGGVHLDLIHELDYIYWLFGKPARVGKTFRNVSSLEISSYDYANYVLEYEGFTASVILNYYRRDYKRTLEVVTTAGTWNADLARNEVSFGGQRVFESAQTFADTYVAQMRHFMGSVKSGERFNDIDEAFEVLKICLE